LRTYAFVLNCITFGIIWKLYLYILHNFLNEAQCAIMIAITNTLFANSGYSPRVPFSHAGTANFWQSTSMLHAEICNVINYVHLCLWWWNKNKPQWPFVTQQETTFTFLDLKFNSHCVLMKCLGQNKICANESSDPIGATSHYKHKFLIIRRLLFPCKVVRCKISLHGNHAKTLNLKSEAQTQTLRNTIM